MRGAVGRMVRVLGEDQAGSTVGSRSAGRRILKLDDGEDESGNEDEATFRYIRSACANT